MAVSQSLTLSKHYFNSFNYSTMENFNLSAVMASCPTKSVTSPLHTLWCVAAASKLGGVVCSHDLSQDEFPIFATFVKVGDLCFDCEESWASFGDECPLDSNDILIEEAMSLDSNEIDEILNSIQC